MVIIDSVNFAGPMSSCPVKKGDTTILNSANPAFSTIAVSGLKYWFRIELAGIPISASQNYPCHLQISQCTCFCTDITIQPSSINTSVCSVDLFNSIHELNGSENSSVFPNPADNLVSIKGSSGPIAIYNSLGQLVLTKQVNGSGDFDISSLTIGVYSLSFINENQKPVTTKLIIRR